MTPFLLFVHIAEAVLESYGTNFGLPSKSIHFCKLSQDFSNLIFSPKSRINYIIPSFSTKSKGAK